MLRSEIKGFFALYITILHLKFLKMLIRWGGYPLGILPNATALQNYRQVDSGARSIMQAHSLTITLVSLATSLFNLQHLKQSIRIFCLIEHIIWKNKRVDNPLFFCRLICLLLYLLFLLSTLCLFGVCTGEDITFVGSFFSCK